MIEKHVKLFIDVVDVQEYHGKSKNWCYDRLKAIRQKFELEPHQRVNVFHFCKYENISEKKFWKMKSLSSSLLTSNAS